MLSLLTGGVSPTLIKDALGVLAILGIVFGIYMWGHSNGVDAGYKNGIAFDKPTIDALHGQVTDLTKQINDQRIALAAKTSTVENSTANATVASANQQATKTVVRTQIVDHYHTVEVPAATSCGVDEAAVTTINQLLETQVTYDNPAPLNLKPSSTLSDPKASKPSASTSVDKSSLVLQMSGTLAGVES
jgi:hypothetical protein